MSTMTSSSPEHLPEELRKEIEDLLRKPVDEVAGKVEGAMNRKVGVLEGRIDALIADMDRAEKLRQKLDNARSSSDSSAEGISREFRQVRRWQVALCSAVLVNLAIGGWVLLTLLTRG